jgi:LPXTG-motif cell wall-anchored protein
MSRLTASLGGLVAVFLAASVAAPAAAQSYDKLKYLTFSQSVQIPGTTLAPGTYRFHVVNPETTRNVLQVLSYDGQTVYSMFHTIPDWRLDATEEPIVTFKEVAWDVAPPIHALFYGGENRGYEFVYDGWVMVAEEKPQPAQPPIAYFRMPAPVVPEPVAEPAPIPAPVIEPTPEPLPEPAPVELPKTASLLPVTTLSGFTAVLAGLALMVMRKRN